MGRIRRTALFALVLAWSALAAGLDPQKAITQYLLDVWGQEQGLPSAAVHDIVQTKDGYLWLATEGGLVRFDGVALKVFTRAAIPGLASNFTRCLFEDRSGALWIGTTGGGVSRYRDGEFTSWTTRSGLSHDFVRSIAQDGRGRIWLATMNGLDRLEGDALAHYTTRDGLPNNQIWTVFVDSRDRLWVAGEGYLARLEGERFVAVQDMPANHIQSMCEDGGGGIWAATLAGLMRWKGDRLAAEGLPGDAARARAFVVRADPAGSLWVGRAQEGLARFRDGAVERLTTAEGLPDDWVRALLFDREGSLWVGTNSGGLCRLKDGKFALYSRSDGLAADAVWSLLEDRGGRMWIGSQGGLNCLERGRMRTVGAAEGLPPGTVQAIAEDGRGRLCVYVQGKGLWSRSARGFAPMPIPGLASTPVLQSLYAARDGGLWMGGIASGIIHVGEGRAKRYTAEDGYTGSLIRCFLEDRSGTVWVGDDGGLGRVEGERVHMFTEAEGWPGGVVYALHEDAEGDLWIGTISGGLILFKDRRFHPVTTRQGLADDAVYSMLEDGAGDLWMDCNNGIFRAPLRALKEAALGRLPRVRCTAYGFADGMRSAECNGGTQTSALRARDGRLWFPTMKGIVVVDPARLPGNPVAPPVVVEELRVDGAAFVPPFPSMFGPGVQKLEIRYTAMSYLWPERVRFRYKLEGYDRDWVDAGTRREAFYTTPPPGKFTFRVRACNSDGVWNEEGARAAFRLKPYFRQTPWFAALLAALGAGAVFAFVRWRMVRLRDRSLELERLVSERTREVQEERDKSDALLHNILPEEIARELREHGVTHPRAYPSATILFTDFKGFTVITSTLPAEALVQELNDIYSHFDDILERHGLEKIKTIGDSYMVAGGVPLERPDHALDCIRAALEMQAFIAGRNRSSAIKWQMRAGIHSGQIIAGVVGRKKFTYDLWGDTVNIASRMEHACEPGRVNISAFTYYLVQGKVQAEYRGKIDVKGKGEVDMYYVLDGPAAPQPSLS